MTLHVIPPVQGLGKSKRALNIVVLSEGFVASRQNVFLAEVGRFNDVLRATRPFDRFPTLITVSALFVPSTDSIAHITDATRCAWRVPNASGQLPPDDAPSPYATPFGALYCRARDNTPARALIPRVVSGNSKKVRATIADEPALSRLNVAPLVLLDNTQAYGGGAHDDIGWFSMKGDMKADWVQVAIHELGHSAFHLADEYDYDGPARFSSTEPSEPNVTTRSTRDELRIFWNATPSKVSLGRWHEFMDPATPAPSSMPNPTCTPLAAQHAQSARPGVAANAVGLFEGAHRSACNIFRPRLDCWMRHVDYKRQDKKQQFCPVCEWVITTKLARQRNFMRVARTATVPGSWTLLTFYHEEPSRVLSRGALARFCRQRPRPARVLRRGDWPLRDPERAGAAAAGSQAASAQRPRRYH
jgi:IgA Peptidase M64